MTLDESTTRALQGSDRRLVRLFAAAVLGRFDLVRALRLEAPAGEPDRRWRETVLQVHVFAGFPRLVEVYGVLDAAGGLGDPAPEELTIADDAHARGSELFERIYGAHALEVRALLVGHHPLFARWIHEHAYARVLARDGLSADRRELLAVAALAGLGQTRQLASHARGAVRCGATLAEVRAVLDALTNIVEPERLASAREVVEYFARRTDET